MMEKEKWTGTFREKKPLVRTPQSISLLPKWQYVITPLGTGIECTSCHHKIKAMDVVMGKYDINICPFCEKEMQPIEQTLLNRMKDEATDRYF